MTTHPTAQATLVVVSFGCGLVGLLVAQAPLPGVLDDGTRRLLGAALATLGAVAVLGWPLLEPRAARDD